MVPPPPGTRGGRSLFAPGGGRPAAVSVQRERSYRAKQDRNACKQCLLQMQRTKTSFGDDELLARRRTSPPCVGARQPSQAPAAPSRAPKRAKPDLQDKAPLRADCDDKCGALWVSLRVLMLRPGSGSTLLVPASQSDRNQAHIVADFSVHFDRCF
jgi:hypothetical protein